MTTATLRLGDSLAVEDRVLTIAAISGNVITLASDEGTNEAWHLPALVAAIGHSDVGGHRLERHGIIEESCHPAVRRARHVERHIIEATTGQPLDGDVVRPAYDRATTSQAERDQAKIAELVAAGYQISLRTWQRMRANHRDWGLAGLIDSRTQRTVYGHDVDPRVVRELVSSLSERANDSTRTKQWVIDDVVARLAHQGASEGPKLPSRATMYRLIDTYSAGTAAFGEAATRRSRASGPEGMFGRTQGYRPGERVEIDSTRADIMVLTADGRAIRPELTAAVDTATRTICAAMLDHSTDSADLSLLLAEMVAPRRVHPDGTDDITRRHRTVPECLRFTDLRTRLDAHSQQPIIVPEMIVADLGPPYRAKQFRRACELLGISLEPARGGRPTDKPTVERTIGSINRQLFQYLPGYVGRNAAQRGRNVQAELTLEQVQDLLDEWIAVVWQRRHHDGLRTIWGGVNLSPNGIAAQFTAVTGELRLPLSVDDYIELLPYKWVAVHRYGVNLDRRIYDSLSLNPLRSVRNPDPRGQGKWELHYNPRNIFEAWLRGPEGWIRLDWAHRDLFTQPFGTRLWAAAKKTSPATTGEALARSALRLQEMLIDANSLTSPRLRIEEESGAPDRSTDLTAPIAAKMANFDPLDWPA